MNTNRALASQVADILVRQGVGESIGVEFENGEWFVDVIESKDYLPSKMDFWHNGVRVKVSSSQPAIPPASIV